MGIIYFGDPPNTVSTCGTVLANLQYHLTSEPPDEETIKLGQEIARKYGLIEE